MTAASKYFTASLGPNFREANHKEFVLDDTDGDTVKMIVDFCCTGHINLTEENINNIVTIASSVELDFLEEKCRQFLSDNLNINNSLETLLIADSYSILRQQAFQFICEAFESIPSTKIQKFDYALFEELLKCNDVDATEEMIFNRLLEWFSKSEDDRKDHMPKFLKLIRLEHFAPQVKRTFKINVLNRHKLNFIIFLAFE